MPRTNPFDARLHAAQARLTGGLSPAAAALALGDWTMHWLNAPGRRADVMRGALRAGASVAAYGAARVLGGEATPPYPVDRRFRGRGWDRAAPATMAQGFLAAEALADACADMPGLSRHHREMMRFGMRQVMDMASPANNPWLNPQVMARTIETGGANLLRGAANFWDDVRRTLTSQPPAGAENFTVGENLATTPGNVVYRDRLIELIQYAPATDTVRPQPILFVPAWIMKYYILDLSPENSMVRWLVAQGFTVFMISWKNPTADDADLGLDDYAAAVIAALDAVARITGTARTHLVGYCIGGTLAALVAAYEARLARDRIASLTLFAAQIEFSDAGELRLFIDDSQLHFLNDQMAARGFLTGRQMAGAFQMLRSNDLIWSRMMRDYLMGERAPLNDLMAWNADATRMPARMHAAYLHSLFLENDFALGRFRLLGQGVTPPDITVPIFQLGTETDHVAPWRSAFKVAQLTDAEVTFVLTNGGHNAGVVSPPDHPRRHFRTMVHAQGTPHPNPDDWLAETAPQDGSWWPAWAAWLAARSDAPAAPPAMGAALAAAPGDYVRAP